MPGRAFTDAERSTAVALARMTSVDSAAATLDIDRRTVRAWVNAAPPEDEGDAWTAARRLAQQQLLTSLATGKVKQPNILAVVAGIASDKLQRLARARDIAQRRQAQQPEPEINPDRDAVEAATDALPADVRQWLVGYIDAREALDEIRERAGAPVPAVPDDGPSLAEWLAWLATSTPEDRAGFDDEMIAEAAALTEGWRVIRSGRPGYLIYRLLDADGQDVLLRGNHPPDTLFRGLPVVDETPPTAAQDVSPAPEPPKALPGPVVAVQRAPTPFVASVTPDDPLDTDTERFDHGHPSWRRLE